MGLRGPRPGGAAGLWRDGGDAHAPPPGLRRYTHAKEVEAALAGDKDIKVKYAESADGSKLNVVVTVAACKSGGRRLATTCPKSAKAAALATLLPAGAPADEGVQVVFKVLQGGKEVKAGTYPAPSSANAIKLLKQVGGWVGKRGWGCHVGADCGEVCGDTQPPAPLPSLAPQALAGNTYFDSVLTTKNPFGGSRAYAIFAPKVIQFFNDDLSDAYSNFNDVAGQVFNTVFALESKLGFGASTAECGAKGC